VIVVTYLLDLESKREREERMSERATKGIVLFFKAIG